MLDFPFASRGLGFDTAVVPAAPFPAASWHPKIITVPPWYLDAKARLFKRCLDIVCALLGLSLFLIAMPFLAAAIRMESPGPILFRQRRIGFLGQSFTLFKFRTMYHHQDGDTAPVRQATRHDSRVTRAGHWLRRYSLDELPQFFNVLIGDMSIVGPRPHAPGTRAGGRLFEEVTHRYAARHCVKPGMTGLAQVRGWRGETETEEKLLSRIESDLEYIATWSPGLDLAIIGRTAGAVFRMHDVY